jgi:hypothetical protein
VAVAYHFIHEGTVVLLRCAQHFKRVREKGADDAADGARREVTASLKVRREPAFDLRERMGRERKNDIEKGGTMVSRGT